MGLESQYDAKADIDEIGFFINFLPIPKIII